MCVCGFCFIIGWLVSVFFFFFFFLGGAVTFPLNLPCEVVNIFVLLLCFWPNNMLTFWSSHFMYYFPAWLAFMLTKTQPKHQLDISVALKSENIPEPVYIFQSL